MRATVTNAVEDGVERANALQDELIQRYVVPYAVTATYWAFAVVFCYVGVQKVLPHRSTADVQLAIVGGLFGIPYIPFVAFVGAWQVAIGLAFLFRRLRLAGMLFFSFQFFAFGSLVVLRYVAFQPPYIPVLGFEFPWALGIYAAFVLKNLVFAGAFFVLATQEFDGPVEGAEVSHG